VYESVPSEDIAILPSSSTPSGENHRSRSWMDTLFGAAVPLAAAVFVIMGVASVTASIQRKESYVRIRSLHQMMGGALTPASTDKNVHCRRDHYVRFFNDIVHTYSDDGLTVKTWAPLYRDVDNKVVVGEYSSVDTIIPKSNGGYTCQQSSFIGTRFESGWYVNQVNAFGICSSSGPKDVWKGDAAVSGGLGRYKDSTGVLSWQCDSKYCVVVVETCVPVDSLSQGTDDAYA
jgi:hypothetical protein